MISDLKTWVTYISIGGILGTLERKALGSKVEEQRDVKKRVYGFENNCVQCFSFIFHYLFIFLFLFIYLYM